MRRQILKWIAGSLALGVVTSLGNSGISPSRAEAANVPTLKKTLEKGLYARLPEQYAFIARVIVLVENDTLSLKLVYSTFKWSMEYDKGRRYYYFKAAIEKRAGDLGVTI